MDRSTPTAAHAIPGVEDLVPIGHGGAGVVYRGRQPALDRDVAVKVVWSRGTPEADLRRWRREVTAMARLSNHPNIVAVYDGGTTDDGLPYLVMPFVPGGTLGDRLRADGPLPPDEVVAIGRKLAGALAAAHAAGVLHRDLKPDNVLLSPYGEPLLSDFGIARLADTTATATGAGGVQATVAYAAPEVLAGKGASEASDVYGLGATLHACLTGAAPYAARQGEPLVATAMRAMSEPAPDLRAAGVPPAVAEVIDAAMAKDPAGRIPTAAELDRRLEAATTGAGAAAGAGAGAGADVTTALPVTTPVSAATAAGAAVVPPAPLGPPVTTVPAAPAARRPVGAIAAVALVLAVLAAVVFALASDDDPDVTATVDDGVATTAAPTPSDPATTAAPATTEGPATTDAADDEDEDEDGDDGEGRGGRDGPPGERGNLGAAAMSYFEALGAGEYEAAYAMTTEGFRDAQPFDGFVEFWSGLGDIRVEGQPQVDEDALTATARLHYDGGSETYVLSFVRDDDGNLLVDGPRPA